MSNEHNVPPAVFDIAEKAMEENLPEHIRQNYVQRLEHIVSFCQAKIYLAGKVKSKK
jgi:hypothetical protein